MLTKDAAIRSNELERGALLAAGVAAFMLGRGDLTGEQMAAVFVEALPRIKKALRRFHVPFIGSITRSAAVSILYDADGRLERPKNLK